MRSAYVVALASFLVACQSVVYSGDPIKLATIRVERLAATANCTGKGITMLSVGATRTGNHKLIDEDDAEFMLRPGRYDFSYSTEEEFGPPGRCWWALNTCIDCSRSLSVEVVAGTIYLFHVTATGAAEFVAL